MDGGPPRGQFDYTLFYIVDGQSISMVNTPAQFFQFSPSYVVVVRGEDLETDPVISCGKHPKPVKIACYLKLGRQQFPTTPHSARTPYIRAAFSPTIFRLSPSESPPNVRSITSWE